MNLGTFAWLVSPSSSAARSSSQGGRVLQMPHHPDDAARHGGLRADGLPAVRRCLRRGRGVPGLHHRRPGFPGGTQASCQCVPGGTTCQPGVNVYVPGVCPVDFVCSVFVFQGGSECNCLPSRAPCAPTDCVSGGTCPGGQVCQRVVASGFLNLSLCLCVAAGSTCCDTLAGTCPGACPAGQVCDDRFTNPTHDCHCAP